MAAVALDIPQVILAQSLRHYAQAAGVHLVGKDDQADYALRMEETELLFTDAGDQTIMRIALPCRAHAVMQAVDEHIARQQRASGHDELFYIGTYTLAMATRMVTCDRHPERAQELTQKEAQLLASLILAGESGCERSALLETIWGYHPDTQTRTLDAHIYRLRQKLADTGDTPPEIQSHDGTIRIMSAAYCE